MMTFWSGAEKDMEGDKRGVWMQSLRSPTLVSHLLDKHHPTCQVQVESQQQVHAKVWQLLRGVQWKAILNDA